MATESEKKQIRSLAQNGKSVNQIKEKLELPKSTVYYHFKKEVGQKQKTNQPQIPNEPEFKGELCGTFAGDGSFNKDKNHHYKISIYLNRSEEYWDILSRHLAQNLEKEPEIFHFDDRNVTELRYNSKKLYEFLKRHLEWSKDKCETIRMKESRDFHREFKLGFIRGLIDTDGYREPKFRRYIYGTISKRLRDNFSDILEEIGIEHTNYYEVPEKEKWRTMHKVRVSGDAAASLQRKIAPRKPKRNYENLERFECN